MKKILILTVILLATGVSAFSADSYVPSTDAKLQYNQGIDYYKVGQYDRAMSAFRAAINLDPNYIDAYFNLGSILEYLNQNEAALTVFKQIIVRKPNDYDSLYKAALLSTKLGYDENAKSYLALIPATSKIYNKAQELAASSLGSDLQTIKNENAPADSEKEASGGNAIYDNIASPTGITGDNNKNLFVASFSDNAVYKITPDGKRIIFVKDTKINGPIDLAADNAGNVYVANYNNNNVLKISTEGTVTVLIGNVQKPYGLYVDGGTLFVSCQGSNSVLKYKL